MLASTYINMMYGIGPNNTITWHIPWGNQGAPIFDYTRFWMYLQGCFWMRLALESVDWVKKTAFPNVSGPILSTEGLSIQKGERENLLSLCDCLLDGTSVFSCLLTGTSQTLGLRLKPYHWLSWVFLCLQLADCRAWTSQPPWPYKPIL